MLNTTVVLCCILILFFAGCKGNGGGTVTTTSTTTTSIDLDNCTYCLKTPTLRLRGCELLPADTFVHADIRTLPLHPRSDIWIERLGGALAPVRLPVALYTSGTYPPIRFGNPISYADSSTRRVRVYNDYYYTDELGYTGLWPIPYNVDVESIADRHVYILETDECASYEMLGFYKFPVYRASAGCRWELSAHDYQPNFYSVLASGLPALPIMLRADEVRAGQIDHVMTFAIPETKKPVGDNETDYLWPAKHSDGRVDDPDAVPIGAWLRLKQSVDTSGFPPSVRTVAEALKVHGLLLVDTGGVTSTMTMGVEKTADWTDADGNSIESEMTSIDQYLFASDFEVVDTAPMRVSDTSMQIR